MKEPLTREQICRRLGYTVQIQLLGEAATAVLAMLQEEREDCLGIMRRHQRAGITESVSLRMAILEVEQRGQPKPTPPEPVKYWPCEHIVNSAQQSGWWYQLANGLRMTVDNWQSCPLCGARRP